MLITISQKESHAISILRISAMFSIVLCHILQAYNDPLAWRFNVGVQIFIVLSGYLYGHKETTNWIRWYYGRFKKLYVPCLIYCLIAMPILHYKSGIPISVKNILTISAVDGLSHLWFMKAIFICYLTTPCLTYLRKWGGYVLLLLLFITILRYLFYDCFSDVLTWVLLYALGFYFPLLKKQWKVVAAYLLLFASIIISIMLYNNHSVLLVDLWHFSYGLSLCIIPITLLMKFISEPIPRTVQVLDSYSFPIYITHHIFLVGPLSLTLLFDNKLVCIVVSLVLITISSILLKKISDFVLKFI